jgi:hypothetical protein
VVGVLPDRADLLAALVGLHDAIVPSPARFFFEQVPCVLRSSWLATACPPAFHADRPLRPQNAGSIDARFCVRVSRGRPRLPKLIVHGDSRSSDIETSVDGDSFALMVLTLLRRPCRKRVVDIRRRRRRWKWCLWDTLVARSGTPRHYRRKGLWYIARTGRRGVWDAK